MFNRNASVKDNISLFVFIRFLMTFHLLVKESISLKGAKSSWNINSLIGKLSNHWPHKKDTQILGQSKWCCTVKDYSISSFIKSVVSSVVFRVFLFSCWPLTFAICEELSHGQLNKVVQSCSGLWCSNRCRLSLSAKGHSPHASFGKENPAFCRARMIACPMNWISCSVY